MSLAHFLTEYAAHPHLDPHYDHWVFDNNFGTFGHVWQPDWSSFPSNGERTPPFDWFEHETLYTLQVEVPGVRKEDLTMHISDDGRSLTIEGKAERHGGAGKILDEGKTKERTSRIKKVKKTMADGSTVYVSRIEKKHSVGSTVKFSRIVTLPGQVDGKRISAKLDNGLLTVSIPKLSTHKPRRIVID